MTTLSHTAMGVRSFVQDAHRIGEVVGLVPTMGALHEGHLALIEQARRECARVIVSIFVNPLQFNEPADFTRYPRPIESDLAMLERANVDFAFVPDVEELYPTGEAQVTVDPGPLGSVLEGASREGHFRGVATVVAKFFAIVTPDRSYFGEKDYQQLAVIRQMTRELGFATELVPCATVRDEDGCAISSRNALLSPEDRRAAVVLFNALSDGKRQIEKGEPSPSHVEAAMAATVKSEPRATLDYAVVRGADQLETLDACDGRMRLLIAATFGDVRLIDNVGVAR